MIISRISVEDGFLNDLDLRLLPGLNVLIGARGTGKTSVIELIRYALGARSHTVESQKKSLEHARSILEGGEVAITLTDFVDEIVITRGADDDGPRSATDFVRPIVLSQMEIETIGLSESARLALLDGFVSNTGQLKSAEAAAISSVRAVFKELDTLRSEITSLSEGLTQIATLRASIANLEQQQVALQAGSRQAAEKQAQMTAIAAEAASISARESMLERFEAGISNWHNTLRQLLDDDFGVEGWDGAADDDPLLEIRSKYETVIAGVEEAAETFGALVDEAEQRRGKLTSRKTELETSARRLRTEVNRISEGAGAIARQSAQVRSQLAQFEGREKLVAERQARLSSLRQRRDERLRDLEKIREQRYSLRSAAADAINAALSPQIRVTLERFAQYGGYTKAIIDALRGSGMRYNELAEVISERMSPRELMTFIDNDDFWGLSEVAGIPKDRAARLLGYLKEYNLGEIVTADVEDNVRMTLLDGLEYKDVAALSAGQRCTVILSVVLQHRERILVIDQPEDHIDNSFIVQTVIKALRDLKVDGQVILSTHNANIPVLGAADLVIELTSDGRNGFVQVCKPLDDEEAVNSITTVMEGGRQAFRDRAAFYKAYEN